MKKQIFLSLALISLIFVSCKKDAEDGISLKTVVAEQPTSGTKTHFDDEMYICWDNGDRVRVNNNNDMELGSGIHEVVVDGEGNAMIKHVKSNGAGYRAIYPASLSTSAPSANNYNGVRLLVTQTYDENKIPLPMVAHAAPGESILSFRPVTALMKVKVAGNLLVKKIVVKGNGTPLSGEGTISGTDEAPLFVVNAGQPDSVVLDCGEGVRVRTDKIFNIIIPATTARFTIRVDAVNDNGEICHYSRSQSSAVTIARSQIGGVPFDIAQATCTHTGRLVGKFQVSERTYCYFSSGNLQSDGTNWRFADRQEVAIGSANATNITGDGYIDLFGWGSYNNPKCHTDNVHDYIYGVHDLAGETDWGVHSIINGGNVGGNWSTLSQGQWSGIFSKQTHGFSIINGVKGVVVLPQSMSSSIASSYTTETWADMAMEGAIFLPVTGWRANGSAVTSATASGAYWTASCSGNEQAYYMGFTPASVDPTVSNTNSPFFTPTRYRGLAVRLVKITY